MELNTNSQDKEEFNTPTQNTNVNQGKRMRTGLSDYKCDAQNINQAYPKCQTPKSENTDFSNDFESFRKTLKPTLKENLQIENNWLGDWSKSLISSLPSNQSKLASKEGVPIHIFSMYYPVHS